MKTTKEQITVRSDTGAPAWRMAAVLCVLAIVVAAMALLMPADVQAATGTPVAGSNLAILQQQSALTLTVVSQNVILNSGAYTVAVPITLTGDSSRKVAAAAFSLDYDSACLQYSSVDFSGISGDFERTIANDNDDTDGELDIAIYDADSPKAQLEAPATVATVTFVVLAPKCQKDTVTDIYFSTAPAPSLGGPGGQQIAVTPVSGTVTIDWNRTATSITLTPVVINENQPVSTTVGTVSSDDPDGVNDTYTFTLVAGAGDTDNGSFTLNGTTLNATPSFNFEVKKDYTVRIQVNDGKGGVYAQQFAITVVDVNETPTALALDSYSVVEDMGSAGQTVANVAVTDPDNGDAFSTDDTFTMTLAGADAAYFDVSDMQITVRASGVLSAEAKSSYTFDVVITDNDGGVYGAVAGNTYKQTVTINVINHSELSIRTATASRPPLWTTMGGGTLQVPVNFLAKGNAVRSSSFQVAYDGACLNFASASGPVVVGYSVSGNVATITGTSSADYSNGDLFTLTFNATGACTTSDNLTNPIYELQITAATVANASSSPLPVYRFDGQAYVIPNDSRGDCNSDGAIDAADFTAIALEIFDDADSSSADDGYWLNAWSVYGAESLFRGSPQGCDASPRIDPGLSWIQVADILCTVNVVFGNAACTTASTARSLDTPTLANLTVAAVHGEANTVDVTLNLTSGNSAAGAALSLTYDPAQLAIDPTDADQDGIPDAIVINGPADYLKLAQVSFLNDQVDFALVDTTAPLGAIGDGVLATVRFTKIGAGEPKVTVTNLSIGDSTATTVPAVVEYTEGLAQAITRLFLPTVIR